MGHEVVYCVVSGGWNDQGRCLGLFNYRRGLGAAMGVALVSVSGKVNALALALAKAKAKAKAA